MLMVRPSVVTGWLSIASPSSRITRLQSPARPVAVTPLTDALSFASPPATVSPMMPLLPASVFASSETSGPLVPNGFT